MITEKREKLILKMSFFSGLLFAITEFIFAIYSHSQSSLTDAVYDTAELVFIALLLFLTPLFHRPVSEKHPFGYFQIETVFIIVKGIMMLSVTLGCLLRCFILPCPAGILWIVHWFPYSSVFWELPVSLFL